jgi:hypothetical protein
LYVSKRGNFCEVKQFCVKYGGWDAKRQFLSNRKNFVGLEANRIDEM